MSAAVLDRVVIPPVARTVMVSRRVQTEVHSKSQEAPRRKIPKVRAPSLSAVPRNEDDVFQRRCHVEERRGDVETSPSSFPPAISPSREVDSLSQIWPLPGECYGA